MGRKLSPATVYMLKALLPYSRENLTLSFSPGRFFYELERKSSYSNATIKGAYYRARKQSLISDEVLPRLTAKGKQKLQPFIATKLQENARLMVVFDIPEEKAELRRQFRTLLRELKFEQAQLSVWITDFDHKDILLEAVEDMQLDGYIQIYESARLFPY